MRWEYLRLREDDTMQHCPAVDADGAVTGHIVIGVKAWFDEHPEERIALGWTKHIMYDYDEIKERWPHNPQTQVLVRTTKQVDEWTIEDEYHVLEKSEEALLMEEIFNTSGLYVPAGHVILDGNGGVLV